MAASKKHLRAKATARPKDISAAVRKLCLWFPETTEVLSHGSPNFRVPGEKGKTFATYSVNHHGDGRIALIVHSPPGTQQFYTEGEPDAFFIPPYIGSKGWLGIQLDKGLPWSQIAQLARAAYEHVAPRSLTDQLGPTIEIQQPKITLHPEDFEPLNNTQAQKKLQKLRDLCLALPESSEHSSFGLPAFQCGKKTFCTVHRRQREMRISFWVGIEAQLGLTLDSRYRVPAYTGRNGWIELNVENSADWSEVSQHLLTSYRHFALKRMLKALESD